MAFPYITIGSPTTGGGQVISANTAFLIEGKPVACVGDKATCTKHKTVTTIVAGDNKMVVMGKPAAQHNSPDLLFILFFTFISVYLIHCSDSATSARYS